MGSFWALAREYGLGPVCLGPIGAGPLAKSLFDCWVECLGGTGRDADAHVRVTTFLAYFSDFGSNIKVLGQNNVFFQLHQKKKTQNHLEISSKTYFWARSVRNWTKTLTSVMSGPAKTCPGGPIRAHMGPYGPQPGQGPNPDWAPTRPGPIVKPSQLRLINDLIKYIT